jgi:hypothetical protein
MELQVRKTHSAKTKLDRSDIQADFTAQAQKNRIKDQFGSLIDKDDWLQVAELAVKVHGDYETVTLQSRDYVCTGLEGRVACARVRQSIGATFDTASMTMFGPVPPSFETVVVDPDGTRLAIPTDEFEIPGILGGKFRCTQYVTPDGVVAFRLMAKLAKKYMPAWEKFGDLVQVEIAANSILQGYAWEANFMTIEVDDMEREVLAPPVYMHFSDELVGVYNERVESALNRYVFEPIRRNGEYRDHDLCPRGVLLYGPPGCGKSLAFARASFLANQHGITYVRLPSKHVGKLADLIRMARRFTGLVVIEVEDIDRAYGQGRTNEVNELLNIIDGTMSKEQRVLLLMSSNDESAIEGVALRPGRTDKYLKVEPPDAKSASVLLERCLADRLAPGETLIEAGKLVEGWQPAFITGVRKDVLLEAAARTGGDEYTVTEADVLRAIPEFKEHLDRVNKPTVVKHHAVVEAALIGAEATRELAKAIESSDERAWATAAAATQATKRTPGIDMASDAPDGTVPSARTAKAAN